MRWDKAGENRVVGVNAEAWEIMSFSVGFFNHRQAHMGQLLYLQRLGTCYLGAERGGINRDKPSSGNMALALS